MENENKIVYYSIGEVSNILDVKESTLRYWEKEFDQLKPKRSDSNRRVYSNDDIEMIKKIMHLLVDMKYTIAGAKEELEKEELEKDNTHSVNIIESEKTEEIPSKNILSKEISSSGVSSKEISSSGVSSKEISPIDLLTGEKEKKRKDYNKIRSELEGILDMLDEDE